MRRFVPLLIAGSALIAAACRDAVAPTRSEETTTIAAFGGGPNSFAALVGPSVDANGTSVTFDILPGGNTAQVGEFRIAFDANAVCDPATSGYGPLYWKQSCTPLGAPITITAHVFSKDGRNYAEFSPDIRFNPAVNVEISTIRKDIIGRSLTLTMILKYGIWYTTRVGDTRYFIDEYFYDPTLLMHFNTTTGRVWRKIRHFSGVVIRTGYCEEFPDDLLCQLGGIE